MDVFNDASCRYYNGKLYFQCCNEEYFFLLLSNCKKKLGCLIVEIHDHRSGNVENNNRTLETEAKMKRIVMKPTAESIWTDITLLSEEWGFPWTEDIALEVEAQILVNAKTIDIEKMSMFFLLIFLFDGLDCYRGTPLFRSFISSNSRK